MKDHNGSERRPSEIQRILELEDLLRRHERKEGSLLLALDHYLNVFEASPEVIFTIDTEGRFVSLNPAFEKLTGWSPDDFLGKPFLELAFPEDVNRVRRTLRRMMDPSRPDRVYKARLHHKGGETVWGEFTIRPLMEEGRVTGFFGIARDITGRIRAEEALRASEEKFRHLFENAPIGIFRSSLEGQPLMANPALVRMLGYDSFEDLTRRDIENRGYPADTPRSEFQRRIHEAGELQGYETKWLKKDGTVIHVRENAKVIRDGDGCICGYEGTVEDTTEHRRALEALKESEERFRLLVEKSPIGIYRSSVDGRFLMANPALVRMMGFDSFEELAKMNIPQNGYHPDTPRRIFQERLHAEGEVRGHESKWLNKDGSVIHIREYSRVVYDAQGNPAAYEGTVEDITPVVEAQEKTRQAMEELQGIFKALPDLYFRMSADSTILNYMAGRTEDLYLPPEQFLGKKIKEILPKPVGNRIAKAVREALRAPDLVTVEYMLPVLGREQYFEARLLPFSGNQVIGVVHNITHRKLSEMALRESEARFRVVTESALVGVYLIQDGTFRYVNPALASIFGYAPEELVDRHSSVDLTHPEDQALVCDHLNRRITGQEPQGRYTFRGRRKDGTVIICEALSRRIEVQGRPAVMGTLLDITEQVRARASLEDNLRSLEHTLSGVIQAMIKIVETRDPYTAGHQQRVAELTSAIALEMGLAPEQIRNVRMAAMIHDIGKIYIPAEILSKPGELSPIEIEMIKTHPQFGFDIVKTIDFPRPIASAVLQHHERLDGSGYPMGLKGDELLMESRILMVADVVEAMASHRPYRSGHGLLKALHEITQHRGLLYDLGVVDACLALFKQRNFEFKTPV
jgi:PAS domain S-box-containing protein/putative nucleotidyltransferase with HDIG domain